MDSTGHMTYEEALQHYGVKGMKWGVRKGSDGVRPIARTLNDSKFGKLSEANAERYNRNKAAKAQGGGRRPSSAAINSARDRVRSEKQKIKRADEKASRIKDEKQRKAALKEVDKMNMQFLNNPDRVTAQYISKGDVFAAGLLGFTLGSPAAIAAPLASRVIARKSIETAQVSRTSKR